MFDDLMIDDQQNRDVSYRRDQGKPAENLMSMKRKCRRRHGPWSNR